MEIKRTIMSEDGKRIAQMVIVLASGAEVVLDDSMSETDGEEAILVKSYPGETKCMGTGDVDLNIQLIESEIIDIQQPNVEYIYRNILRNLGDN